jgi:hypothetical protein
MEPVPSPQAAALAGSHAILRHGAGLPLSPSQEPQDSTQLPTSLAEHIPELTLPPAMSSPHPKEELAPSGQLSRVVGCREPTDQKLSPVI